MLKNEIESFQGAIFTQSLKYKKPRPLKTPAQALLGAIDFEYIKQRLLSVQLLIKGTFKIFYISEEESKTFGLDELKILIVNFLDETGIKYKSHKHYRTLYLASYYSTAELSMLKDFWNKAIVRNVTPKIVNISFPLIENKRKEVENSKRGYFSCHIIDIYHFFIDMKTTSGKKSLEAVSNEFEETRSLGGKMSIDGIGGKSEQYWKENMDKLLTRFPKTFEQYALQDVIITVALLKAYRNKIWKELGVDLLSASTNGSIATNFFRSYEMQPGKVFGNSNISVRKFVLQCSHGAVMVALKRGFFEKMYESDAKGFYTYSMRNTRLLPRNAEDIKQADTLKELLSSYDGWAAVEFDFPDVYNDKKVLPTLPVQEYMPLKDSYNKGKKPSLILFPKTGLSYCTISEVRGALNFGCKIKFVEGYYYTQGTTSLSDFASKEMRLREISKQKKDKIGEAIHKSLPNHFVGKLFQHKGGFEIEQAKNIAQYLETPIANVISGAESVSERTIQEHLEGLLARTKKEKWSKEKIKNDVLLSLLLKIKAHGTEVTQKTRIGACWLPEHWSLILGRARAALWFVINTYAQDPVHISTDSYHDVIPLNGEIDTPFGTYVFEPTSKEGKEMYINRTKLYTHGEKIAQHAVHIRDNEKVRKMIVDAVKTKYNKTGTNTLRAACINDTAFGASCETEMQFDPRWDNKMCIEPYGSTRPWDSIEEYFYYIENQSLLTPERIKREDKKRDIAYKKIQTAKRQQARVFMKTDVMNKDGMLNREEQIEDAVNEQKRWCN